MTAGNNHAKERASGARPLLYALLGLAFSGLVLSVDLAWIHWRLFMDPTYDAFCGTKTIFDCETVALSRGSVVLGVPLALWGVIGYGWAGALTIAALLGQRRGNVVALAAVSLFSLCLALVALILASFSGIFLGSVCQLCLASHLVSLAMVITSGLASKRSKLGGLLSRARCLFTWTHRHKLDTALWLGCGALALSIPFGLVPPYWEVAAYRVAHVAFGHDRDGLPWIGAPEPKIVVHEYHDYECPYCSVAHIKLRRLLQRHEERFRIVRHDTPRVECPLEPAPGDERVDACRSIRGAYCASQQQKYWSWNDAALRLPKPGSGPARLRYEEDLAAALALDTTAFSSCLDSPQAFAHARKRYQEARRAKVLHLPSHMMNGQRVHLRDIEAALSKNH